MSKQVFYNPEKHELEKKQKVERNIDQERRDKYFASLSKDKRFHKYIIEEIIDGLIKEYSNMSAEYMVLLEKTPETVKSLIIERAGALKGVQNIKNEILKQMR